MAPSYKSTPKVTQNGCIEWIYGPQVSYKDGSYGVGSELWASTYYSCIKDHEKGYGLITPKFVFDMVTKPSQRKQRFEEILNSLVKSENILNVLLIFSAFINALGLLFLEKKLVGAPELLDKYYRQIYNITEKLLEDPTDIKYFVTPENFLELKINTTSRPKNIMKKYKDVAESILLKEQRDGINKNQIVNPVNNQLLHCDATTRVDCTNMFQSITNPLFRPLADVLKCNCSYFKQKLRKINTMDTTFHEPKMVHDISNGDIQAFKTECQALAPVAKSPIVIRKYLDGIKCEDKNYLSQLFEKTCDIMYKPYFSVPKRNILEDMLIAAMNNDEISKYKCKGYLNTLSIFQTPIINNTAPLPHRPNQSNIPVFFLEVVGGQQEKLNADPYNGPSVQFFTDVMKELVIHKVFIPSKTFFNNQRYELNVDFEIENIECYRNLPEGIKNKPELKEKIKTYFFLFIGNLIHFAVANNIELPFKLSRVYIAKIFNIFDFMGRNSNNDLSILLRKNIDKQMLLISIYFLEKADQNYTKKIIEILQDPEKLKDPALIAILDLEQDNYDEGIRMNGNTTIVKDNFPIYSDDKEELIYNVIEYLYKTALKHYFGDFNDDDTIIDNSFQMHPYIDTFFNGFNYLKSYFHNTYKVHMNIFKPTKMNFHQRMALIRKTDMYLSGFGISYKSIKFTLIDNIVIKYHNKTINVESIVHPLSHFNEANKWKDEYIAKDDDFKNDDLHAEKFAELERQYDKDYALQIKMTFNLYRILLNNGRNISKEFIAGYNNKFYNIPYDIETTTLHENMTEEDYHNEFVKLLLKTWTGTPTIGGKDYKLIFDFSKNKLPHTYTCFNNMYIEKPYPTVKEFYDDLVILTTSGTNFGEALIAGGKKKKRSK